MVSNKENELLDAKKEFWVDLTSPSQVARILRAQTLSSSSVKINKKERSAIIQGSGSSPYQVTLTECSCPDFRFRRVPCKHMCRLAMELGELDRIPKPKGEEVKACAEIKYLFDLWQSGVISAHEFVEAGKVFEKSARNKTVKQITDEKLSPDKVSLFVGYEDD